MKFSYDDHGDISHFFALGLALLYAVPATVLHLRYFLTDDGEKAASDSDRVALSSNKWDKHRSKPKRFTKRHAAWLCVLGLIAALIAFPPPAREVDASVVISTPFTILGVSKSSTAKEIGRAYRTLAKKEHPDVSTRPKDEAEKFWREVNEAKEILTDPVKRKNWIEFGHPDGPQPMVMGLALPGWLVERENQYLVILLYFLVLGGLIPYSIAKFYRTNQKFSGSGEVMMQTQWGLYRSELEGDVQIQQLLDILSASIEYHDLIPQRPTDKDDLRTILINLVEKFGPQLREAGNIKYNLMRPASIKAKLLLVAHLHSIPVPERLVEDQRKVLELAPRLVDGMMNMAFLKSQQTFQMSVVVLRAMDLLVTIVQARLAHTMPPIYQLPYISHGKNDEIFKKEKMMMPQQIYDLDDAKRREVCSYMNDTEYKEMMTILDSMPIVTIKSDFETSGEKQVVPGSIVTVKVKLERLSMRKMKELKKDGKWADVITDVKNNKDDDADAAKGPMTEEQIDELFRQAIRKKQEKRAKLQTTKNAPIAYCPDFPTVRREKWWLIVMLEPRRGQPAPILTAPKVINDLEDVLDEEVTFQAPPQSGVFNLIVQVKSMDYAGFDSRRIVKLEISKGDQNQTQSGSDDSDVEELEG